jgi:hypothetical protein
MGEVVKWDSVDWRKVRDVKLTEWLGPDGAECIVLLSTVSEVWDDLVDRDKTVPASDISNAFIISLVNIETNVFWQTYRTFLFPVMVLGINAWLDANALQNSRVEKYRMLGFYIRNYAAELVQMAAFCVGGFEHMRKVSLEVREFLNHETYFEWENRHVD